MLSVIPVQGEGFKNSVAGVTKSIKQAMTGQVGNSYVLGSPLPQNQDDGKHAISVIEVAVMKRKLLT